MPSRTRGILSNAKSSLPLRDCSSWVAVVAVLVAVAGCSSSKTSEPGKVNPPQTSRSSTGVAPVQVPLRIVYREKSAYADSDPLEWTRTVLSDGNRKVRITWNPHVYDDWVVSDGARAVESQDHGSLVYLTRDEVSQVLPFVTPAQLPMVCPGAVRVGSPTILGRQAIRYTCEKGGQQISFAEITMDSKSGLLLATVSGDGTSEVTSIELNPQIPVGSFDLSAFPSPAAR